MKANYDLGGKTILTLWILKYELRIEVRDPEKQIEHESLYESGKQFEDGGWRNFKFRPELSSTQTFVGN